MNVHSAEYGVGCEKCDARLTKPEQQAAASSAGCKQQPCRVAVNNFDHDNDNPPAMPFDGVRLNS